jgi:hypothetical protein
MKTIISIGFALILGWAVTGQGTANAQGSPDTYAFNPYTMSKKPLIQDGFMPVAVKLIKLQTGSITPDYGFPRYPNSEFSVPSGSGNADYYPNYPNSSVTEPNNDPNEDGMPKVRIATYVVRQHQPY